MVSVSCVSFCSCPEGFHSSLQPLHAEHVLTLPHLFLLRIGPNHRAPAPGHQRVAFSFFVLSMQVHGSPFAGSESCLRISQSDMHPQRD